MSIRQGLLALLMDGPQYGYQLRSAFEQRTGAVWPLNVGQVYTTLARLERDGLVQAEGSDEEGRVRYQLLSAGQDEVAGWFASPVARESRPRDELAIKLALAVSTPSVDVSTVVQTQRTDSLRALQDYTRLKRRAEPGDLAWLLVLESMIFQTEAEVRWLDHCEAMVARLRRSDTERLRRSDTERPRRDEPMVSRDVGEREVTSSAATAPALPSSEDVSGRRTTASRTEGGR